MTDRRLAGAWLVLCLLTRAALDCRAADDATLFRVFLKDGTSLVSYGEFARVGDRVVFSMPTAARAEPAAAARDIRRRSRRLGPHDRYADVGARGALHRDAGRERLHRAVEPDRADAERRRRHDRDPARRLRSSSSARKTLADWPRSHFNYRAGRDPADARRCSTRRSPICARRPAPEQLRSEPRRAFADAAADARAAAAGADAAGGDRADAARGAA